MALFQKPIISDKHHNNRKNNTNSPHKYVDEDADKIPYCCNKWVCKR